MKKIAVALLGLGNVGQGVVKVIQQNAKQWPKKCGAEIVIKKVLVQDPQRVREVSLAPGIMTTKWKDIIEDPDIQVIIEVMGGIEPTRSYILEAMKRKKHIVTANKDLLAEYGQELFETAQSMGIDLYFEASVGGGIPIVHPLKEGLAANNIQQVMGIINGTTNYILTRMSQEGKDFTTALAEAQALGYAETDPSADIEGLDAARKTAILASLAFHTRVQIKDVFVEGIKAITPQDLQYAKNLGFGIKLLGIARQDNGEVEVRVHPSLIPLDHPLATVNDAFNAIFIQGDAVGQAMFFGRGAGQMPTASSVVGDLLLVINNIHGKSTGHNACTCYENKKVKPMGEISTQYYLRILVLDRPGVLASIAGIFGNHGVSLANVIQQQNSIEGYAELVVITHQVKEKNIQDALKIIKELTMTKEIVNLIRVEGL